MKRWNASIPSEGERRADVQKHEQEVAAFKREAEQRIKDAQAAVERRKTANKLRWLCKTMYHYNLSQAYLLSLMQ